MAGPESRPDEIREAANEVKFVVDRNCARAIGEWASAHLGPDPNAQDEGGCYQTTSLYFDTEGLDVLNQNGSYARSKYRVRRYGRGEGAFLERKLKKDGAVSKRRSIVGLNDLSRLTASGAERGWNGYWFHRRLLARRLRPVCQISYRRMARVNATSSGVIRLTLDQGLRAQRTAELRFENDSRGIPLSENLPILELKFREEMPEVFSRLMEEFRLSPQTISKYRLAAAALPFLQSALLPAR